MPEALAIYGVGHGDSLLYKEQNWFEYLIILF